MLSLDNSVRLPFISAVFLALVQCLIWAATIMLIYSTRNIGSGTCVERIVNALDYINIPYFIPFGGSARSPDSSDSSLAHHHGEQGKTSLPFNRREVFPRRTMVAFTRRKPKTLVIFIERNYRY